MRTEHVSAERVVVVDALVVRKVDWMFEMSDCLFAQKINVDYAYHLKMLAWVEGLVNPA